MLIIGADRANHGGVGVIGAEFFTPLQHVVTFAAPVKGFGTSALPPVRTRGSGFFLGFDTSEGATSFGFLGCQLADSFFGRLTHGITAGVVAGYWVPNSYCIVGNHESVLPDSFGAECFCSGGDLDVSHVVSPLWFEVRCLVGY